VSTRRRVYLSAAVAGAVVVGLLAGASAVEPKQVVGVWTGTTPDGDAVELTITADGKIVARITEDHETEVYQGAWRVEGETLVVTLVDEEGDKSEHKFATRFDGAKMVLTNEEGEPVVFTRKGEAATRPATRPASRPTTLSSR
jgi:uncharacterized protein (TIGR03066 family)